MHPGPRGEVKHKLSIDILFLNGLPVAVEKVMRFKHSYTGYDVLSEAKWFLFLPITETARDCKQGKRIADFK